MYECVCVCFLCEQGGNAILEGGFVLGLCLVEEEEVGDVGVFLLELLVGEEELLFEVGGEDEEGGSRGGGGGGGCGWERVFFVGDYG